MYRPFLNGKSPGVFARAAEGLLHLLPGEPDHVDQFPGFVGDLQPPLSSRLKPAIEIAQKFCVTMVASRHAALLPGNSSPIESMFA
jgi:hypothetical protein